MATGQSHLVTYRAADSIERMFARSSVAGYTALQQSSMPHQLGSPPPSFGFALNANKDGETAVAALYYTGGIWVVQTRNIDSLANIGSVGLHFDTQTWATGKVGKKRPVMFALNRTTALWGVGILPTGNVSTVYAASSNAVDASNNCLAVHPNEDCLFVGAGASKSKILKYSSDVTASGQQYPVFDTPVPTIFGYAVIDAEFSNSGLYMFAVGDDMQLHCFTWDSVAGLNEQVALPLPAGTSVVALAIRPDDRYIAVSTYDGTNYRTYIYRRKGYVAQLFQSLGTGIGQLLDWSADGSRLIDAANKKCFKFDTVSNQFVDASSEVTNLPTNVTAAAVNSFMEQLIATGFGYSEGVRRMVENDTFDIANIKIMLLNSSATFDASATDMLELTPFEVSDTAWPAGGKLLANAEIADNTNGQAALIADKVRQILINSLTFRYAVIYDATNSVPLLFMDFQSTIVTEAEKALVFDVSELGAFTFLP